MKKVFIIIIVLLASLVLPIIFQYSELSVQKIDNINKDSFEELKQRGFISSCFPKNTKNIVTTWDIDTNEFYMKFEIKDNEFYDFDKCTLVKKNDIKMPHEKGWIKKMIYPSFVTEINKEIRTNNHLISYVSYKNYKLAKDEPFYILIDKNNKVGFAFSN